MPASKGDTVTVEYEGRLEDGTVFDTSANRAPLLFTLGAGDVLPDFEAAVIGLEPGGRATVTITAENAYGPRFEEAVQVVPVDAFGESAPPVGGQFSVIGEDGEEYFGRVVSVSEDMVDVTVDFNHPLAGHTLEFDVELVEIVPSEAAEGATSDGS